MENAHCALYMNIWFHITMCNSVKNHFSYNILTLLQNMVQYREVCGLLRSPIFYCAILYSFVQFLQFCAVFAVLCSDGHMALKHLIVWLQCRGVVQQCSAAVV